MAKRATGPARPRKVKARKTKKRLEIKKAMLAAKASKGKK